MTYVLKHRDQALLRFNLTSDPIAGLSAEILECNSRAQSFFPLDLTPTDAGLLKWLKRRVIPRNRAFVQSFLAKLGLNVNDTKGIIDICRGLSLNDCYWVADESFAGTFARYNLYENKFSRILSLIAYTGYGESIRS
ncbi:MAG: XRE family transcriptional regulator, partial [Candidatus Electrothrix sp. LOE1_4_5]|nr:XRE family transcriptional regulator [Candidatus Electrothrix gigas]